MKKLLLLFVLLPFLLQASNPPAEKARGVFVAVGLGPRLPVGGFASSTDLGYGFNIEVSYSDNEYLPIFLFGRAGYEQYPGSQSFYKATDYSNFSTAVLPVNIGARYYFPPMLENIVLFMPIVEISGAFNYYQKLHEFKPGAQRSNFTEESSKIGVSAGAGISMFLMEIMAQYNWLQTNQYVSIDLRIRLPLFVNF